MDSTNRQDETRIDCNQWKVSGVDITVSTLYFRDALEEALALFFRRFRVETCVQMT